MPFSKRWIAVGTLVAIGAMWFAARGIVALDVANRGDAWLLVVAYVFGAAIAGAVITRHATVHAWREPLIAVGLAIAFFIGVALGRDQNNSVVGPIGMMSPLQVVVMALAALVAAYGSGHVGRRFTTSVLSTPAIILLSGLIMNGATMMAVGTTAALQGHHQFRSVAMPFVILAIAAAGFLTQAVVATRRPWTCASGGLLMLLLFVQENRTPSISAVLGAIVAFTLVGWIGARIAVRVFRGRWDKPVVPEAIAR